MAHRLLHTLVFSSVIALESVGCGSSPQAAEEDEAPLTYEETSGDEATVTDEGVADATPVQDASDPRLCENGWATTKSASVRYTFNELPTGETERCDRTTEQECCIMPTAEAAE